LATRRGDRPGTGRDDRSARRPGESARANRRNHLRPRADLPGEARRGGRFGLTVATTGASEKGLRRAGVTGFERIYLHPGHHAGYYPGATPIHLKLLFSIPGGRILGAQAVGLEGVEKRIDVIATAIQMGATVRDLAETELCYAPQFGGAKDPVNLAGMIAVNHLDGLMPLAVWQALGTNGAMVIDVREPDEYARGHIPGARNLPLSVLRQRYRELPTDRPLSVYCGVGQRAYYATRFLNLNGYQAANLSGGFATYEAMLGAGLLTSHESASGSR
jgi:rhodanese-related sulfurtransferase